MVTEKYTTEMPRQAFSIIEDVKGLQTFFLSVGSKYYLQQNLFMKNKVQVPLIIWSFFLLGSLFVFSNSLDSRSTWKIVFSSVTMVIALGFVAALLVQRRRQ